MSPHAGNFGWNHTRVEILLLEQVEFLIPAYQWLEVFQDPPALRHHGLGVALAKFIEFAVGDGDGG